MAGGRRTAASPSRPYDRGNSQWLTLAEARTARRGLVEQLHKGQNRQWTLAQTRGSSSTHSRAPDPSDARARAAQARFAGEARSHGVAEAVEPVRALRGGLARQKVACTRVGTECSGVEPRSGGSHVNTPTSEHQRRPFFTECREEDHVGIQASSELKQSAESRKSYLGG